MQQAVEATWKTKQVAKILGRKKGCEKNTGQQEKVKVRWVVGRGGLGGLEGGCASIAVPAQPSVPSLRSSSSTTSFSSLSLSSSLLLCTTAKPSKSSGSPRRRAGPQSSDTSTGNLQKSINSCPIQSMSMQWLSSSWPKPFLTKTPHFNKKIFPVTKSSWNPFYQRGLFAQTPSFSLFSTVLKNDFVLLHIRDGGISSILRLQGNWLSILPTTFGFCGEISLSWNQKWKIIILDELNNMQRLSAAR